MGEPAGDRETRHRIVDASARDRRVCVRWDDGRVSEFHCLWLRDNCPCEGCRHPRTGERTFDLSTVPADLGAASVRLTESGALDVTWAGDDHPSRHDPAWLRINGYSAQSPRAD